MAPIREFKGFFSYTHHDAATDPGLIANFTSELERRVNARLVNARFSVWRDKDQLRTGNRWDPRIEAALRGADVLVVLLTPQWIGSDYCRKEYTIFEGVEASRTVGEYVAPILARPIGRQEQHFTPEQRDIFIRIQQRQYFEANATEFLTLSTDQRSAKIEKIADDVAGMIERLRTLPTALNALAEPETPPDQMAQDFVQVIEEALAGWRQRIGGAPVTARSSAPAAHREDGLPAQRGDSRLVDLAVFRDAEFAPELVVIPAGEFRMGSTEDEAGGFEDERPQHRVTVGRRFAIGRYPVAFEEYDWFCEAKGRNKPQDEGWGRGRRPVINLSWDDAQAYVAWLTQETGRTYRLPSEAEWEYACRAGTTTRYSFGDAIAPENANYFGSQLGGTSEVGSYPANPWGLHDMHGNVWEWVEDDWHGNYRGAPADGSAWTGQGGPADHHFCVVRGGSWDGGPGDCRSDCRLRSYAGIRVSGSGFRVARTLS